MKLSSKEIMDRAERIPGEMRLPEVDRLYHLTNWAPNGGWFVELGSCQGRSASAICQGGEETKHPVMLIDTFKYGIDGQKEKLSINLKALGFDPTIIEGDSRVIPDGYPNIKVAMLFIDTDHHAKHFEAEWKTWKPHLMTGAIVACHDYNSPTWTEMNGVIDKYLGQYERLCLVTRLIAFRYGINQEV